MMMLDPKSVQVLFADLQPQMVARSKTNPPEALARSVAVLAQVARLLHLPMHLSVVPEGGQPPELIPELARETEGVAQLPRISFSPFFDEATRAAIAATGRQHLVIAGFATEVVVLHAVRDALAAGYRVLCRWMRAAACRPVRRTRRFDRSRRPAASRRPSSRWSRPWCPMLARTSAGRPSRFFSCSGWHSSIIQRR